MDSTCLRTLLHQRRDLPLAVKAYLQRQLERTLVKGW